MTQHLVVEIAKTATSSIDYAAAYWVGMFIFAGVLGLWALKDDDGDRATRGESLMAIAVSAMFGAAAGIFTLVVQR